MFTRLIALSAFTGMLGAVLVWAQRVNRRARAEAALWADATDSLH